MSAEEAQKGLQYQLDRSPQLTSAPAPAQHPRQQEDYKTELKRRQISAREWIAPWLTGQARSKSLDAMGALRKSRTADLSPQQQDTALKRLLGQSWQVAAANPVAVYSDDEDGDLDVNMQNHFLEGFRPQS